MLPGDYLLGLMAIITGLAISAMVTNLHGLLIRRRDVTWDWLALCAAAYIFVVIVNSWGVSYRSFAGLRSSPPLWMYLDTMGQIIPLYLAARAAFPEKSPAEEVDLAAHYQKVSRYFWAAMAIAYFLYLTLAMFMGGIGRIARQEWFAELSLLLMVPLIASRDRRVHRIAVPIILLALCAYALPRPLLG